jgi:thioredoxin
MAIIPELEGTAFNKDVLESPIPVLVDFSAVWCSPCKMIEPILVNIANEWAGKIKIVMIDVDHSPEIAMEYQVMSVPTLMLFVNRQMCERLTGYQSKDRIVTKMQPYLSGV